MDTWVVFHILAFVNIVTTDPKFFHTDGGEGLCHWEQKTKTVLVSDTEPCHLTDYYLVWSSPQPMDAHAFLHIWRTERVSHLHRVIQPIKAHHSLSQRRKLCLYDAAELWAVLPSGTGAELHSDLHRNCGGQNSLTTHIVLFPGAIFRHMWRRIWE